MYSDSYATAIGIFPLTCQFTKKTGYSTTTTISEPNQFTSKTYVDSLISALSSIYLSIANATSTYLTIANASLTYQTIANMSGYLLSSVAASTYLTISTFNSTILDYYT